MVALSFFLMRPAKGGNDARRGSGNAAIKKRPPPGGRRMIAVPLPFVSESLPKPRLRAHGRTRDGLLGRKSARSASCSGRYSPASARFLAPTESSLKGPSRRVLFPVSAFIQILSRIRGPVKRSINIFPGCTWRQCWRRPSESLGHRLEPRDSSLAVKHRQCPTRETDVDGFRKRHLSSSPGKHDDPRGALLQSEVIPRMQRERRTAVSFDR